MKLPLRLTTLAFTAVLSVILVVTPSASAIIDLGGLSNPLDGQALLRLKQDAVWYDSTKPQACGGFDDGSVSIPSGDTDQNAQAVYDYFVNTAQLQPFQAAAIIGNMMVESAVMPQRLEGTGVKVITPAAEAVNRQAGWGIVQWTPAGKFIFTQGPAPYTAANNLGTQVSFLWEQLQGTGRLSEKQAGDDLKATPNIEEAVLAFQGNMNGNPSPAGKHYRGYERPRDQNASVKLRTSYARSALTKYGSGASDQTQTSSSTTDCVDGDADMLVMTYNILGSSHDGGEKAGGSWQDRMKRVITTINDVNPTIIGMQELNEGSRDQQEMLYSAIGNTYTMFPALHKNGAVRPLFWNKTQFTPVDTGTVGTPKENRVSQIPWAILEHNTSKRKFFVMNTHMQVGDSNANSDDRAENARIMVRTIKEKNTENLPVILTGDMNSTCNKSSGDRNQETLPCTIFKNAGLGLQDSEERGRTEGATFTGDDYATSHGSMPADSRKKDHHVDHVFVSDGVTKVVSWTNIVNDTTKIASDHTPLVVGLLTGINPTGGDGWGWPVKGNIRTGNCWNVVYNGGHHAGMDMNSTVPGNEAITAHNGTVVKVVTGVRGYDRSQPVGNYVTVKTDTTPAIWYSYEHLASVAVKEGQTVKKGELIGVIGTTGFVVNGGPGHLHFVTAVSNTLGSYANNSQTRDPMDYLPKDNPPSGYKCSGGSSRN